MIVLYRYVCMVFSAINHKPYIDI